MNFIPIPTGSPWAPRGTRYPRPRAVLYFRGVGDSRLLRDKNDFSLDLNTESLPMTDAGSEFQTNGAAHRKERFAKSVRANGWMSSGVAVERSVRALTRLLICWQRFRGTDVFRIVYLKHRLPCSQLCVEQDVVYRSVVSIGTAVCSHKAQS